MLRTVTCAIRTNLHDLISTDQNDIIFAPNRSLAGQAVTLTTGPTEPSTSEPDRMTTHTILQLSDMHFVAAAGGPVYGHDPDAHLELVLSACEPHLGDVDLVVVSGDLTDDQSPAAYERLRRRINRLGFPSIAFAGNHDDASTLADHFDVPEVTTLGAWQVVSVDTARPGQVHGTIDVDPVARTLERLDGPVLVAMHHPPTSPSTRHTFSLDNDTEFLSLIEASPQVKAIISGHLHEPFERVLPGGAALYGCPSTLTGAIHEGDTYRNGEGTVIGAQFINLGDDRTVENRLVTIGN